jgi:hypothetical protein
MTTWAAITPVYLAVLVVVMSPREGLVQLRRRHQFQHSFEVGQPRDRPFASHLAAWQILRSMRSCTRARSATRGRTACRVPWNSSTSCGGTRLASVCDVARPSRGYEPRSPSESVLYQIVRDHLEAFRARAERVCEGERLPRFIVDEFEGFLRCGSLAGGFARFRCDGCGLDRLVPFSCKGRAVCPSCGGRRMAERAAHLVDHVFPPVPVRQWVLSLPHQIRYVLAWDHTLCRAVVGVFMRAVLGFLQRQARARQGVTNERGGAVAIIQRFGAALNLNSTFTHSCWMACMRKTRVVCSFIQPSRRPTKRWTIWSARSSAGSAAFSPGAGRGRW